MNYLPLTFSESMEHQTCARLAQEAMAAEEEEEEVEEGVQDRLAADENEAGSGSEGDADDEGSGEWHGMEDRCFLSQCAAPP